MDSSTIKYIASKRKKRTQSQIQIIDSSLVNNKKFKFSTKDNINELKLIHYIENLIISKDFSDDFQMNNYRSQVIDNNLNNNIFDELDIDIKIETCSKTPRYEFWDCKNLISFLDYEKMTIKMFDYKSISNDNNRVILRKDFLKYEEKMFVSFLRFLHIYSKNFKKEFQRSSKEDLMEID